MLALGTGLWFAGDWFGHGRPDRLRHGETAGDLANDRSVGNSADRARMDRWGAQKKAKYRTAEIEALDVPGLRKVLGDPAYSPTTRNDAANRLLRERDPRLAGELIRMLNDETEDLTWRNYCVQFVRSCYEQDQQPQVLKALEDTCRHKLPELSSCALWGLAQLAVPRPWMATAGADHLPMFDELTKAPSPRPSPTRGEGETKAPTPPPSPAKGEGETKAPSPRPSPTAGGEGEAKVHAEAPFENPLDKPLLPTESDTKARALALAWLSDDKGHLLTRTSGAQSCSRMGVKDAAPKLRELAAAAAEPISLRVVCIAGLAQLNDQDSRPLLEGLADDKSQRVRQAAEMALKKLNARLQHGGTE
jgi:hypothetical protein